jgi:hypothetical protein
MTLDNSQTKVVVVVVGNQLSRSFAVTSGVRQGDALSATLFNLALHKVIKITGVYGTTVYKSKQACGYEDDSVLIGRNILALTELCNVLESKGKQIGLNINL